MDSNRAKKHPWLILSQELLLSALNMLKLESFLHLTILGCTIDLSSEAKDPQFSAQQLGKDSVAYPRHPEKTELKKRPCHVVKNYANAVHRK